MNRRLRTALVAVSLLAPALVTSAAQATVSTDDAAADVIELGQQDKVGDVRVAKKDRGRLSAKALSTVDLTGVDHRVDRVAQLLTITYSVRHRPVPVRPFRLYHATFVMEDPKDLAAPTTILYSRAGQSVVSTLDLATGTLHKCAGSKAVVSGGGRVVSQTVPFSCLGAEVDHGVLWSGVGIERANAGDVAFDTARRTRDLPLTAYVAPPAG